MEITERELRARARDVDERHREAMRTFAADTSATHRAAIDAGRRRFLIGAGVGAAAIAVGVGVGFDPRTIGFGAPAGAQSITDADLAAFAQSVELAAVAAYGMAAAALGSATKPVATLFMQHHQQHADAFGALAGAKAVKGPNQKLVTALTPALQAVKDEKSALELAFTLENQAAYTYAFGLTAATGVQAASGMATILPIETEHASVLGAALAKPFDALFPTGAFEAAVVGNGTDPKKGIDPTVFPVA